MKDQVRMSDLIQEVCFLLVARNVQDEISPERIHMKGGPISSVWVPEDFPGVEKVVLSMGGDGNAEALWVPLPAKDMGMFFSLPQPGSCSVRQVFWDRKCHSYACACSKWVIVLNPAKWSESEVTQLCLILCDPMDRSLSGSSVHGIFQARVLEWGAIAFPRGSSRPRDWAWVPRVVGRCFTVWAKCASDFLLWNMLCAQWQGKEWSKLTFIECLSVPVLDNLVSFILTSVYFSAHFVSSSLNSTMISKAREWETTIITPVIILTSLKLPRYRGKSTAQGGHFIIIKLHLSRNDPAFRTWISLS